MQTTNGQEKSVRGLIVGVGEIVLKMQPTWHLFAKKGVNIFATDVEAAPQGRVALPKEAKYFNSRNATELESLLVEAKAMPFDFAYLSTIPPLHLAEAFKWDVFAKRLIIPKPVDSHYAMLETLHAQEKSNGSYKALIDRIYIHDHYRNKPLTTYLKGHLKDLHRRNGFLKNIRLYIVEHRTIQKEFKRRPALECGMILDLAPHALSVVCELIPNELEWKDLEGNTFKRVHREIHVVCAVRARDNACILHTNSAETFAALHFKVKELIHFIPNEHTDVMDALTREFDVLAVVGKGVSLSEGEGELNRDLKAIEIEFDGQVVRGNFDSNAVTGVIDDKLQEQLLSLVNPEHRGLNLPFMDLADNGFNFDTLNARRLVAPFQSFGEAFRISRLLDTCHKESAIHNRELVRYCPHTSLSALLNRCVAAGLDHKWALKEEPTSLVFGKVPKNAIQ